MPILTIENLKKTYGAKTVLAIPSLSIENNKITAIIGPSGAGKSTLLSIINGLEKPTEGKIVFQKEEFSASKQYSQSTRRAMAMVFQKPLMFNTSVYKNIAYGLQMRREKKRTIAQNVQELAKKIGLAAQLHQKATTLSGGEAGRVSVARAIMIRPVLLLLDEPTASLDPANICLIEQLLLQAKTELQTSIIIVTHNLFQAKRLADQVIFMLDGSVVEIGKAEDIFNKPQDARTKAFVSGDMVY
ncbi:MAG: phosphate ABC transporter ATP-binding protein [Clostridia bacterium]